MNLLFVFEQLDNHGHFRVIVCKFYIRNCGILVDKTVRAKTAESRHCIVFVIILSFGLRIHKRTDDR